MRFLDRRHAMAAAFALGLFAAAPAARADLSATTDVPVSASAHPGGAPANLDVRTYDIATGGFANLGVDTAANEFHPSVAGNRLAFEREQDGAIRIIVHDTVSAQEADLFNGFEAASIKPTDPSIGDDGQVVTGTDVCALQNLLTATTGSFPNGPFSHHNLFSATGNCGAVRQVLHLGTDDLFAFDTRSSGCSCVIREIVEGNEATGAIIGTLSPTTGGGFGHPAQAPGGSVMVFEGNALHGTPGLYFTSTPLQGNQHGPGTYLPSPVNTAGFTAYRPAFSADGRYLAFVRTSSDPAVHDRLLVWDSQTHLLLSPTGIDLGKVPDALATRVALDGNVALVNRPVLSSTSISLSGNITAHLLSASNIGIIVQKVVGRTRVFGRSAPKLRFLGRVPLGRFARGRAHVHWDRKVNGRRLGPGLYQVTVRSVTPRAGVRDLGRPALIRIRSATRR